MSKSKAQIQKNYEKKLKEGLKAIENATITYEAKDDEIPKLIDPYTSIVLDQLCADLKVDSFESKAVGRIFNWVRQGKSLDDIKKTKFSEYISGNKTANSSIIEKNIQYIFDAATVYKENIEKETKLFAESFKKMKIAEMPDACIKNMIKNGKFGEANQDGKIVYTGKALDTSVNIKAKDYVQKYANKLIESSHQPYSDGRIFANYIKNPRIPLEIKLKLADLSYTKEGKIELCQIIVNEIMNIDFDKYAQMKGEDIYYDYDEYYYAQYMAFDNSIFATDTTVKNFLSENEITLLNNYVKNYQTIIAQNISELELDISNVSKMIDWRNIPESQAIAASDSEGYDKDQYAAAVTYITTFLRANLGRQLGDTTEIAKENLAKAKASMKERGFSLDKYNPYYAKLINSYNTLHSELAHLSKESSAEVLKEKLIHDFYEKETKLTYDQFCAEFNVKEKLSDEEIASRANITKKAIEQVVTVRNNHLLATEFDKSEHKGIASNRALSHALLSQNPKDKQKNLEVIKAFAEKDPAKMKAAVTERFNYLLSKKELLNRPYTDQELVDNWVDLSEVLIAVGMEHKNLMGILSKMNVEIDPGLEKQMDDYYKLASNFNNFYANRLDYMCTQYYKFGAEKNLPELDSKYIGNTELCRTIMSETTISVNAHLALGSQLRYNMSEYGNYPLNGIYDAKDPSKALDDEQLGNLLAKGEDVVVVYQDDIKAKHVNIKDPNTFPFETEEKELSIELKSEFALAKFNKAAEDILNDKSLSKNEKNLQGSILESQFKLAAIVNGAEGNVNYATDSRECAAELMAKVTLLEMFKKTPDETIRKELIKEQNIKEFADKLQKSGVAEIVAQNMKRNTGNGVLNLSMKDLYKEMVKANQVIAEKNLQKNAPNKEKEMVHEDKNLNVKQ